MNFRQKWITMKLHTSDLVTIASALESHAVARALQSQIDGWRPSEAAMEQATIYMLKARFITELNKLYEPRKEKP